MKISLNGIWKIVDSDKEFEFEGHVPGCVQGDLVDLGKLPHPYIGTNETLFRRLEDKEWYYTHKFNMNDLQNNIKYELVFKGIDTLSSIYLNGEFIGDTEDMFLEYRFDINGILKKGKNVLKVNIKSPVKEPRALERTYGEIGSTSEESARPYIRKAQYSYGWDWGARVVTSGIWRSVYIESYNRARLTGCTAYLEKVCDKEGKIRISGYIASPIDLDDLQSYRVEVRVNDKTLSKLPIEYGPIGIQFNGTFTLKNIRLWFPNGLGEQYLYKFKFILKYKDIEIYKEKKKIGLRAVELIRKQDIEGETFIFAVNGKRVFAKGANWIPADNILTWIKSEDYEKLLYMAREANINMLRIWGGGIYEDEQFYALCDKLGIMVWQDFMFACAEYPDHLEWFRALSNREVREVVRRLRYHPSIVLWCGNNENNWGFDEWPMMSHKVDGEYLGNKLYLHDFPIICAEEDPSRPYWPSSPYGGDKANSASSGDYHIWNVWSGWADYKDYAKESGRFISEFGFQAAPDPKTINFFIKKEEQEIFHPFILNHNKQKEGQERILRFINTHFGIITKFDAFVYLSQLSQAEAIKFGVEHWRARKYRTAGTLYWQYNDSWPVFSWSCVDYFKRPKALYYYTKKYLMNHKSSNWLKLVVGFFIITIPLIIWGIFYPYFYSLWENLISWSISNFIFNFLFGLSIFSIIKRIKQNEKKVNLKVVFSSLAVISVLILYLLFPIISKIILISYFNIYVFIITLIVIIFVLFELFNSWLNENKIWRAKIMKNLPDPTYLIIVGTFSYCIALNSFYLIFLSP